VASLGDILFRDSAVWKRLVGNQTTTKQFLSQTGSGAASAAPVWATLVAANLSDYVGPTSWTPTLEFGGGNTGIAYTTRFANYIRIGDLVIVWGRITLSNKGSSVGTADIASLPFNVKNTSGLFGVISIPQFQSMSSVNGLGGICVTNTDQIQLYTNPAAGGATSQLTNSNFTNTSDLIFGGPYIKA